MLKEILMAIFWDRYWNRHLGVFLAEKGTDFHILCITHVCIHYIQFELSFFERCVIWDRCFWNRCLGVFWLKRGLIFKNPYCASILTLLICFFMNLVEKDLGLVENRYIHKNLSNLIIFTIYVLSLFYSICVKVNWSFNQSLSSCFSWSRSNWSGHPSIWTEN